MWDRTRNQMLLLYILISITICFVFGFYIGKVNMRNNLKKTCDQYLSNIEKHEIKSVRIVHGDKVYMDLNLNVLYNENKQLKKEDLNKIKEHYNLDYINTNYLK